MSETIYALSQAIPGWLLWITPRLRQTKKMVHSLIWEGQFRGRFEDEAFAKQEFPWVNESKSMRRALYLLSFLNGLPSIALSLLMGWLVFAYCCCPLKSIFHRVLCL